MAQGIFTLKHVNQAIRQGAWSSFNPPQYVEYLCVAGGGGGANNRGGAGGAGGFLTGIVPVTAGASYTVTVGAGGATRTSNGNGNNGANSAFGTISSMGGGGGGDNTGSFGNVGGSGGGGGTTASDFGSQGITGQGNRGGGGTYGAPEYGTGGGGGAGTRGTTGGKIGLQGGGNGGAGVASDISGIRTTYAGGGGGSCYTTASKVGLGGVGGGGAGESGASGGGVKGNTDAVSGAVNTGGGGGGAYNANSGSGGSGIVIVRYPGNIVFYTGGTVNYNNGYISHIFNATGTLAPATPAAYNTSYQIARSLRFNSADSTYLNRTPATATNQKTWTYSGWIKRSIVSNGSYPQLMSADGGTYGSKIGFFNADEFFVDVGQGATYTRLTSTQVFRDFSAWYHVVVVQDTTQATNTNRVKVYINGSQITLTGTYPTQNFDGSINNASAQNIGRETSASYYYNGYMTEVNFIDGQALTPSSFGATSTTTGVWAPIKYTGTYGTNGFYLNFSDNTNTTATTLGKDYSGNGNNWTPNSFSVTAGADNDSVVDTPTPYGFDTGVGGEVRGNYCTWNPLSNTAGSLSNGNLQLNGTASIYVRCNATMAMSSGKWYFETTLTTASSYTSIGIGQGFITNQYPGQDALSYTFTLENPYIKNNDVDVAYGSALSAGDVFMCAFDLDNNKIFFGKNGTWFNSSNPATGTSPAYTVTAGTYTVISRPYSSGSVTNFNFGQRAFAYTAPSGFKALCTQNLPTPAIGGSSETLANEFFNVVTWTGTGTSSARSITGVGFQPDFVWSKPRSVAYQHNLYDAVRGGGKRLNTADYAAEVSNATNGYLSSFDTDGFSTTAGATNNENWNQTSATYVAWNWRAGNNSGAALAGTVNATGSIASLVSANPRSKFSVVSYTGNGTSGSTVGHGLDATPSMIIVKQRSAGLYNWRVYHSSLTAGYNLWLNLTNAQFQGSADDRGYISGVSPTTFTLTNGTNNGDAVNASGVTFIAYCWAAVPGYSAFGSYTGNGSLDGTFVHTGFRPAYLMVKSSSNSSTSWVVEDTTRSTTNVMDARLFLETADAETINGNGNIDFLSNGFKLRNSHASMNASSVTYIYMAFAENPFKYSLAR